MKKPSKSKKSIISNKKGVALLMAIFTFTLVSAISMEMLKETHVEYVSSSQGVNRLKSYYAAKTGMEIGLLRVLIYQKALALAGDSLGSNASLLDQIWSFPFIWPPQLPKEASEVDQQLVNDSVKESLIDTAISTQISSESSKIDLNDLASPSEALAKSVRKQLLRLFQSKVDSDERFSNIYRDYDFTSLVNNITDWVDEDSESLNGGDEGRSYRQLTSDSIPPNQAFKTKDELHMVAGMTDELFEVLSSNITVYGASGIQVNSASKEVLITIDEGIVPEIADEIIKHRNDKEEGGPFPDLKSFLEFLDQQGLTLVQEDFEKESTPLIFDSELNFRITSTGSYSQIQREIVAIVYDFDRVKDRVASLLKDTDEEQEQTEEEKKAEEEARKKLEDKCKDDEGEDKFLCLCEAEKDTEEKDKCIQSERTKSEKTSEDNAKDKKKEPPKGRPNVVFWLEK